MFTPNDAVSKTLVLFSYNSTDPPFVALIDVARVPPTAPFFNQKSTPEPLTC